MRKMAFGVLALFAAGWLTLSPAWAQTPTGATVISVPTMDCAVCAKKVVAKVNDVPGVASVGMNLKERTLIVQPKAGATLSPLGLWDAVEKSGKPPAWLQGPSGTFKKKPTF